MPWKLGCQHKKSNTFFFSGTMLYSIATKYLHIFKDKKKSYLPGVLFIGISFVRFIGPTGFEVVVCNACMYIVYTQYSSTCLGQTNATFSVVISTKNRLRAPKLAINRSLKFLCCRLVIMTMRGGDSIM